MTQWPPIPRQIYAPGGYITVRQVVNPRNTEDSPEVQASEIAMGLWKPDMREILLRKTLPPAALWNTLYHEWAHAALEDAGLRPLIPESLMEPIVDAIGLARMQELRVTKGIMG